MKRMKRNIRSVGRDGGLGQGCRKGAGKNEEKEEEEKGCGKRKGGGEGEAEEGRRIRRRSSFRVIFDR